MTDHHQKQQPYATAEQPQYGSAPSCISSSLSDTASTTTMFSTAVYSAYSVSTAPPPAYPGVDNDDRPLVCEFRDLLGCDGSFGPDETDAWIEHIASHLGGRFPAASLCWFCDHVGVFEASPPPSVAKSSSSKNNNSSSSSTKQGARRQAFEARLRHVREHVVGAVPGDDGGYYRYGYDNLRPDFLVIKHLYRHGLVDRDTFDACMSYTELPADLARMRPDVFGDQQAWPSPLSPSALGRGSRRTGSLVVYDQAKEDRHRRREEGKTKIIKIKVKK